MRFYVYFCAYVFVCMFVCAWPCACVCTGMRLHGCVCVCVALRVHVYVRKLGSILNFVFCLSLLSRAFSLFRLLFYVTITVAASDTTGDHLVEVKKGVYGHSVHI